MYVSILCGAVNIVNAQQVYRCTDLSGKTVYSDRQCSNEKSSSKQINTNPNTLDRSEARAQSEREKWQRENERQYWAEEHQRQSNEAQQASADHRYEKERKKALNEATTVLPGARGMTRSQRERAVELATTPIERAKLMLEAKRVMPGARGLTASQVDTARRLHEVNRGNPLPPAASYKISPSLPPPNQQPQPETPSLVVNCDGAGCWDTNGRRLSGQQQVSDHKNQTYTSSQSSPECAPHRPPALWPFCT